MFNNPDDEHMMPDPDAREQWARDYLNAELGYNPGGIALAATVVVICAIAGVVYCTGANIQF